MHLLHIYSFYSCWQGGYLYAFTAYLFFSHAFTSYLYILQLLASYTRKRRALVMSLEIPRISLKFLSKLYILQILATCIVLCAFAGYLIKGYHYLIAQSSNFISFEKFFFPEPQIQLQLWDFIPPPFGNFSNPYDHGHSPTKHHIPLYKFPVSHPVHIF